LAAIPVVDVELDNSELQEYDDPTSNFSSSITFSDYGLVKCISKKREQPSTGNYQDREMLFLMAYVITCRGPWRFQ